MFATQHTEILASIAALAMTCSGVSEEQMVMVFENRMLGEIFGPKETAY
jgi:hypothetical protein